MIITINLGESFFKATYHKLLDNYPPASIVYRSPISIIPGIQFDMTFFDEIGGNIEMTLTAMRKVNNGID